MTGYEDPLPQRIAEVMTNPGNGQRIRGSGEWLLQSLVWGGKHAVSSPTTRQGKPTAEAAVHQVTTLESRLVKLPALCHADANRGIGWQGSGTRPSDGHRAKR